MSSTSIRTILRSGWPSRCAAALVMLIGVLSLLGWVFDIEAFKHWTSQGIHIKANTAIALVLAGLSVCLYLPGRLAPWARRFGQACAWIILLLGALCLSEHLFGWDLGIDQLLFHEEPGPAGSLSPGRVGPPASLCFVLGGIALLLLHARSKNNYFLVQALAVAVLLISAPGMIGYAYGAESMYGIAKYSAIALHTALALAIFAVSLLLARPEEGLYALFLDPGFGGLLARRLLPPAILIPLTFGYFRLRWEEMGHFTAHFGTALMMLIMMTLFSALILWSASLSRRLERARMRAEHLQAQERANLQSIFDVVNVGMLLIDESGAVRRVNNTVSRWFGKNFDHYIGVQPGELVGCIHAITDPAGCGHTAHCNACPIRNTFESVFRTGESVHDVESEARVSLDGKEIGLWLEASADPLLLDGRRHVVMALNNISARKQIEHSLQRTTEELVRSNRDLEQFAYVASHDLQEPLRMVAGYLQLLEERYKGKLDEKADKYIAYAVDGAARMAGLIRDLLAFSRVNTRGEQLCSVESQQAFDAALRNLCVSVQESGATITHDPLPTVRADLPQLTQLFQNLLGNAIKFRSPDRKPTIHVAIREEEEQWRFSVRDNGIGFEQEYEDKIFLIFQRLHGRGHYPGTGIGLAICKRIVERHGGDIWAASTPDQGATFFFTLPS
jgi:signal transduction histidine kinase